MITKISAFILFLFSIGFAQMFQPELVVQNKTHDFGTITTGDIVVHTFVLTNNGGDVLKIDGVKASCGCTAAKPDKSELAPGESTNLVVTFNSKGRRGPQKKTIRITSNDPQNKEMLLSITADVADKEDTSGSPSIQFSESNHDFGNLKEGDVVDYTFKFSNAGDGLLKISDITTSCGCTAALVSSDHLKPGEDGTIKVELNTKHKSGKMTRTVTIKSNDPKEPSKVLVIYASVEKADS
jgi:Protein of unknown function (DUF1573)